MTTSCPSFIFQTPDGWTVENAPGLVDGGWELGVPINCSRGDPPADALGQGGSCFLTDNAPAPDCNTDVDGSFTRLMSPVLDLSGLRDPVLSYARWYSNSTGTAPGEDTLVVEVSADGGDTWVLLETVGPGAGSANPDVNGGWRTRAFDIARTVSPGARFRLRFTASDEGSPSIVEAAVDSVTITGVRVQSPPGSCPGDADGDARVTFQDVIMVLSTWGGPGPTGDVNASGRVDFDDIVSVLANWGGVCRL